MDTIKLTWSLDAGGDGVDSDPDNPMSRAVNRLFQTGQPFKRLSMLFFAQTSITNVSYRRLHWLGVFVLSQADRLIFFPGFNDSYKHIKTYQGQSPKWDQYFDFDHLTLNADFKFSHTTSRSSKTHIGNFPTSNLGDGRFLWFGLSISEFEVLRPVYKETEIVMEVPESDVKRRAKVFMDSREEAKFQIIENHPDSNGLSAQRFMHISFIVGPSGFGTYIGQNHGFPEGSPFLLQPLPEGVVQLPVRIHRVSISQSIDLQITTAWVPGKLKGPLTFTMTH